MTQQHIFQAFSILSDAQELIAAGRAQGANDLVNHAKLHLLEIINADQDAFVQAMADLSLSCTLPGQSMAHQKRITTLGS